MKISGEKIAIVIPAANEEKTVKKLCTELIKNIDKYGLDAVVYFVLDKASRDNTRQILERFGKIDKRIKVIYEPRNKHVVDARIRGFREAIKRKYDFIIEMDCGMSHLPSELHKFTEGIREGHDCVFGVRNLWSLKYKVPLYRRVYSLGGTILANLLLGTKLSDMTSGYEAFSRKALKKILASPVLSTDHFFQTEMRYKARNFRFKEVRITYSAPTPRVGKSSVYNSFESLLKLAYERFTSVR